jgi:hypothetical protein
MNAYRMQSHFTTLIFNVCCIASQQEALAVVARNE